MFLYVPELTYLPSCLHSVLPNPSRKGSMLKNKEFISKDVYSPFVEYYNFHITKTRLFKYIENFTSEN